jgi:hypothetical protein
MITQSKAVVLVLVSFLAVTLVFSSFVSVALARKKHVATDITCSRNFNNQGDVTSTTCCWEDYDVDTVTNKISNYQKWCVICDPYGNNCGPEYQAARYANGGPLNPPSLGTALPPVNNSGAVTNGQKGNPSHLGNALPTGNNTGTPGKTSIFNPVRNATNALPSSNGTGTPSLGSIIRTPVNHTKALPTNNNTGTPPALKLSQPSLAGQQPKMQQTTGHHHKGSNTGASTSTGSNSTGH